MSTRESIIELADDLLRRRGYNAFSFSDISKELGIKNASVHYHFPTKTDLAVGIVEEHRRRLHRLMQRSEAKAPPARLQAFLHIYDEAKQCNRICLVGALATDWHTLEAPVARALTRLAEEILQWVTDILSDGKKSGQFVFPETPRTRAMLIITSMVGAVQLNRLVQPGHFGRIRRSILAALMP